MNLYEKYHINPADERLQLFEILRSEFDVESGLYPGCFVHVTPSFVIPQMVYVDSNTGARRFFEEGTAQSTVLDRKNYPAEPEITFFRQDYSKPLPVEDGSVDLLISQYAGFVSENCKRYLRFGGYLIANNSHGDAGLACSDADFELAAVVDRRGENFTLRTKNLHEYFVPKSRSLPTDVRATRAYLKALGRGLGYAKSAAGYVFLRRTIRA